MRIWSLHPKYLDTKGLVAVWRETLLAKHVLENKTKGYKHHPQLERFKKSEKPLDRINQYLSEIFQEAIARNYKFDREKINWNFVPDKMPVTRGQLEYELNHLLKKLKSRDPAKFRELKKIKKYETLDMFVRIEGEIESWEITG